MSRETLVLLPGMMCDRRLFAPQIAHFEGTFAIHVGELIGEDSVTGLAEKLLREIESSRFSLAGLSMGGIIAMAMAGLAPERVSRLAMLDTNHRADPPERRPIREAQIAAVGEGRLDAVIVEEMKPNYLAAENRDDSALLNLLVDMAMELGPVAFVSQSVALRDRADQSAALASFHGPSLVLCGEEDTLCPPARHREIAALLANSELKIIPGAGHIVTLEQPEAVNAALAAWLARPADQHPSHAT